MIVYPFTRTITGANRRASTAPMPGTEDPGGV
jgi:hypothetical protein